MGDEGGLGMEVLVGMVDGAATGREEMAAGHGVDGARMEMRIKASSSPKGKKNEIDGAGGLEKGKLDSSHTTCREMMTRPILRLRQPKPL